MMLEKQIQRGFLILALLCCAIPLLVLCISEEAPDGTEAAQPSATAALQSIDPEVSSFDQAITLRILTDAGVQDCSLQEYLCGVLLAEMSDDFSDEAMKAQAVASRTFALQQAQRGKHPGADVCADASCCQGWTAPTADCADCLSAVMATDGLVVTYGDQLIEATFFSCSGGQTEAAIAVWGSDVPYLQSVSSPGEESAPRFTESYVLAFSDFAYALEEISDCILSGTPEAWFGSVTRTPGGSVATIEIGGHCFSGTELRRLLALRSTDVDFSVEEGGIRITTWGYGHRVGLSQYGAEAMAQEGAGFAEILLHYYQNTTIKRLFLTEQASDAQYS